MRQGVTRLPARCLAQPSHQASSRVFTPLPQIFKELIKMPTGRIFTDTIFYLGLPPPVAQESEDLIGLRSRRFLLRFPTSFRITLLLGLSRLRSFKRRYIVAVPLLAILIFKELSRFPRRCSIVIQIVIDVSY